MGRTLEQERIYRASHREQYRETSRRWKTKHKEKVRASRKEWERKHPNWRAKYKETQKRCYKSWVERNKEHYIITKRAHEKAYKVPLKEKCEICGSPAKERHHPDYSKPLEIMHLCVQCHKKQHMKGTSP